MNGTTVTYGHAPAFGSGGVTYQGGWKPIVSGPFGSNYGTSAPAPYAGQYDNDPRYKPAAAPAAQAPATPARPAPLTGYSTAAQRGNTAATTFGRPQGSPFAEALGGSTLAPTTNAAPLNTQRPSPFATALGDDSEEETGFGKKNPFGY